VLARVVQLHSGAYAAYEFDDSDYFAIKDICRETFVKLTEMVLALTELPCLQIKQYIKPAGLDATEHPMIKIVSQAVRKVAEYILSAI
jgi:hypothetical protein